MPLLTATTGKGVVQPERKFNGAIRGSAVVAVLLLLAYGTFFWQLNRRVTGEAAAVAHARAIVEAVDAVRERVLVLHFGVGGPVASGDGTTPASVREMLELLRGLAVDQPSLERGIAALQPVIDDALASIPRAGDAAPSASAGNEAVVTESLRRLAALDTGFQALRGDELRIALAGEEQLSQTRQLMQSLLAVAAMTGFALFSLAWALARSAARSGAGLGAAPAPGVRRITGGGARPAAEEPARRIVDLQAENKALRATEEALRISQQLLQTAMEVGGIGTWIWESSSGVATGDEQTRRLLTGRFAADPGHATDMSRNRIYPQDLPIRKAEEAAAGRERRDFDCEYRIVRDDGVIRWLRTRGRRLENERGNLVRMVGASTDITERKEAELLVAGQNRVLAMIAAGAPLTATLEALLSVVEDLEKDMLCSVLLLDADGVHVHCGAAPRLPAAYSRALEGKAIGPKTGSCGTAMHRGEPVIVADIASDPLWEDYRHLALPHGLRACWSTPVFDAAGKVLGAFAIYSLKPGVPEARHQRMIEAVTQTAAIAIESAGAAQTAREARRSLEHEVDERRSAEAELQRARGQLQAAFAHARMGSWSLEIASGQLHFDEALLKVFGSDDPRTGDLTLQHHLSRNVYRPDQQRVQAEIEAALAGEDYDTEYRIFSRVHGICWLGAKGLVIRGADGTPLRMLGISRDITERKQGQTLMAGQNRVLTMIASGAPLAETIDVLEKLIEEAEPELHCSVWRLDGAWLRMLSSKRLLAAQGIPVVVPANEQGGPSGSAVVRRVPVVTVDTLTDPLWDNARAQAEKYGVRACWSTPIFDSANNVVGAFSLYSSKPGAPQPRHQYAIDIAVKTAAIAIDSASAAQALREVKEGLEHKVADRTRDLQAANERLQEVDRLKSQFLANMSHELRTPLNAILGFAGTLLMRLPGALTSDQENQLGIIRSSAQHLLSLINDLLDLAKIESGKMALRVEAIDCRSLLDEVAATLQPLADRKRLPLLVDSAGSPQRVTTDLRALKQIVINLTNNAIKFTDHGRVTLGLRSVTREGRPWVEFDVADTGIGIKTEDRERLFQAFSQMDGTVREGTGLGLHLSQKFARLVGGHIEFESEYGKGSRFSLLLPGD